MRVRQCLVLFYRSFTLRESRQRSPSLKTHSFSFYFKRYPKQVTEAMRVRQCLALFYCPFTLRESRRGISVDQDLLIFIFIQPASIPGRAIFCNLDRYVLLDQELEEDDDWQELRVCDFGVLDLRHIRGWMIELAGESGSYLPRSNRKSPAESMGWLCAWPFISTSLLS